MSAVDVNDILAVVQTYLDGLHEGDTAKLRRSFFPQAHLFSATGDEFVNVPLDKWCEMVEGRPSPKSRGLTRKHERILAIDITGPNTAMVKLNCAILPRLFTDYLSLIRMDGRWGVINKTYHYEVVPED